MIPATGSRKAIFAPGSELVIVRRVVKHAIPDTMAIMFFLNNNMPDKYKNRNDSTVTQMQVIKVAELDGVSVTSIRKAKEAILARQRKDQEQALLTIRPGQQS